jgi:Inner membrane component of T3SS, cytoplasmic domain
VTDQPGTPAPVPAPGPVPRGRIVVADGDLVGPQIDSAVTRMINAQQVPLVREVGAPQVSSRSGGKQTAILWGAMAGAGVAAGVATWLFVKAIENSFQSATASNLVFSVGLAAIIGIVITAVDAGLSRNIKKVGVALAIATPTALVSGLALGALASQIYVSAQKHILTDFLGTVNPNWSDQQAFQAFIQYQESHNHIWRGIAWALCGLAAGITVGVASRSWRRTILTSAGGLIGGFIGGFVFDFFSGQDAAQVVGFVITGMLVALAMVVVEQAVKSYWIEVASGGMAGKQFILYVDRATIGAAATSSITLVKDPTIAAVHAVITRTGGRASIEAPSPTAPVLLDGTPITQAPLHDGALITLGSTILRFRERGSAAQPVGEIRRS